MINTELFSPRNLIVIAAIVLITKMIAKRACEKLDAQA
jgi:hypothetical protein